MKVAHRDLLLVLAAMLGGAVGGVIFTACEFSVQNAKPTPAVFEFIDSDNDVGGMMVARFRHKATGACFVLAKHGTGAGVTFAPSEVCQ